MKVGVAKETAPGERRVALVPEVLGKLKAAGLDILVESGAGAGAAIPDSAFTEAGATIVSTVELLRPGRRHPPRREAVSGGDQGASLRPGRHRLPVAADRPGIGPGARQPGRDRDQPRRDPADAVAGADDGRPELPGQRRWLQGRPARRQRVRALLPAADHGGRHGQAGQRADPGHRRRRAAGDRHRPPARRGRQGLRRPARDPRAGRVARRPVRQAQDDDRCDRRRRLRPRADARGARRPAGRAQRGHRRRWTWSSPRPRSPAASRRCWSPRTPSPG